MNNKILNCLLTVFLLTVVCSLIGQNQLHYQTGVAGGNNTHRLAIQEYQGKIYLADVNSLLEIDSKGNLLTVCPLFNEQYATPLYYKRDSSRELIVMFNDDITITSLAGNLKDIIPENSWFSKYEVAIATHFFKGPRFYREK